MNKPAQFLLIMNAILTGNDGDVRESSATISYLIHGLLTDLFEGVIENSDA